MYPLPNHVTRYNHRHPGLLDAPKTYAVRSFSGIGEKMVIACAVAVLIVVSVMILQAL